MSKPSSQQPIPSNKSIYPSSDESLLLVTNLSKSFGSTTVINNFSYRFKAGAFGIVGPNGIGKSTFLSLVSGMLKADSGDVLINGASTQSADLRAKAMLGYAPDAKLIYPFMTGNELIELVCVVKSVNDKGQLLSIVDAFSLKQHLHVPFCEMSEGMQRKFALVAALLGQNVVLVLDEPTNALDERSVDFLREEILYRQQRSIILFATHNLGFLESVDATQLNAQTLFNC